MISIFVVLIAALALMAVILFFMKGVRSSPGGEPARYPFESRPPLTEREQVLYWRLRKMLPDQIVLSQVGLSRMLRVQQGHDFRAWFNRIDRMTIDFLVCRPDATIVAAIELDDATHGPAERMAADEKKAKALESAGIRLLRFREIPAEAELREALLG